MSASEWAGESLARRILEWEADAGDTPHPRAAPGGVEKLRVYLTAFVGAAGFQALLARALALSKAEAPWLASVQVTGEGTLSGFHTAAQALGADDARRGELVLLTRVLELLVLFIGENVTLHMVRDVWSRADIDDLNSSAKESM